MITNKQEKGITITNINIPFADLVMLIMKITLAFVPAGFIISGVVYLVLSGLMGIAINF